jgi:hypothetical protein
MSEIYDHRNRNLRSRKNHGGLTRLIVQQSLAGILIMHTLVGCSGHDEAQNPLEQALASHAGLQKVLEHPEEYRLQIVLGLVEEGADGRPFLRQYTYRAGAEYFYPASSVKLFAAIAAMQKLADLREQTGLDLNLDTPMVVHPLFEDDVLEDSDPDNLQNGKITIKQQIRKILLVSDNQAFNYLYEFAGPDGIHASLEAAGLSAPRIIHRLSEARSEEENRQLPQIDFVTDEYVYKLPQRSVDPLPNREIVEHTNVGSAYISGAEQVAGAMDFSGKNYFPLNDLQRGLCMVILPDIDCGGPGFNLKEYDRQVLLEAMSQYPRESLNPRYDPDEYPDDYVKDLLPGLTRVVPADQLRIFSKTGTAYGFSTENAWVADQGNDRGFFIAATLYTNADGVLNDDQYEYTTVARPFISDLGEALARVLWYSNN